MPHHLTLTAFNLYGVDYDGSFAFSFLFLFSFIALGAIKYHRLHVKIDHFKSTLKIVKSHDDCLNGAKKEIMERTQ